MVALPPNAGNAISAGITVTLADFLVSAMFPGSSSPPGAAYGADRPVCRSGPSPSRDPARQPARAVTVYSTSFCPEAERPSPSVHDPVLGVKAEPASRVAFGEP